MNAHIELATATRTGVADHKITLFGSGFGADQLSGSVTIHGKEAVIDEWADGYIRAIVPAVPDGDGTLRVSNHIGKVMTADRKSVV